MIVENSISINIAETIEEVDGLVPLMMQAHKESRFRHFKPNLSKRRLELYKAIENPNQYGLIVARRNGIAVGYVYCMVGRILAGEALSATAQVLYVSRSVRQKLRGGEAAIRLLNAFITWAKNRNVDDIQIHNTSGIDVDRTSKFIKRAGFEYVGANFSLNPRK